MLVVGVVTGGRGHAVPRLPAAGLLPALRRDRQPAVWSEDEGPKRALAASEYTPLLGRNRQTDRQTDKQ